MTKSAIRVLCVVLLVGVALLAVAIPTIAYLYRAPLTIAEDNGNDYAALSVTCSEDIDFLVDNGFISSATGLDTRVETFGGDEQLHMLAEDRIMVFAPTLNGNSQLNWYFTTGNTALASFPIIVGDGGYITTLDHANLELGTDFEVEFDGYVDTSVTTDPTVEDSNTSVETVATTSHTVALPGTIAGGNLLIILFGIRDGAAVIATPAGWTEIFNDETGVGRALSAAVFYKIATDSEGASVTITTTQSDPSAHQTFAIDNYYGVPEVTAGTDNSGHPNSDSLSPSWNTAGDTLFISMFVARDATASSISSPPANYGADLYVETAATFTSAGSSTRLTESSAENPGAYTMSDTQDGYIAMTVGVRGSHPLVEKEAAFSMYVDDGDINAKIFGGIEKVVATTQSSEKYIVNAWADNADLGIDIDGSTESSIALGGASVTDNGNDWVLSPIYWDYYTHTTSSVLRITYEPDDIIAGTTLINETNPGTHDSTITWGSNPAGVTAILGSMVPPESAITTETGEDAYRETLPDTEVSDWFVEPDVGVRLATNPLRPLVTMMSDSTTITEIQSWRFLGLAILLLVTVSAAALVRGHLLIAGLACGGTVALLAQQTIWPGWTVVFIIPAIIAGLMAERTPQI